jgi:hypothetical protein
MLELNSSVSLTRAAAAVPLAAEIAITGVYVLATLLIVLYVLWKKSILKGSFWDHLIGWLDPAAVGFCRIFVGSETTCTRLGTKADQIANQLEKERKESVRKDSALR